MADELLLDAETSPSIDEEAAALVSGLGDYAGYITGDDDDSIVDLATLLAVGSDASDTSIVDSQSETVGDPEAEGEVESAEEAADEADPEADPEADAEAEDAADETEGDTKDSDPKVEAKVDKAVPPESKDMRVLRESHKFRVAVEPLIKDYADELPEALGIAAAVRTGKGDSALSAISAYSESAAHSIRSHVLESEAEDFVAQKLGVTSDALKTMFAEAPETPEALKAEMEYLSDEARAELEGLLRKPVLSDAKDKAMQSRLEAVTKDLIDERRGGVEAAIDWQFNVLVEKAKLTEDIKILSNRALEQMGANEVASKAIAEAFEHAQEGRKNDAARQVKIVFKELAKIVKGMAAQQQPASKVAAEPKITAPKAPVVKAAVQQKSKVASAAASPVAEGKQKAQGLSDADLLKFGRAEAKRLGVAWKD